MATTPSPNDLTRQQLDELDSLLQRMLALPLNTPEPAAAFPPPPPLPEVPPAPPPRPTGWRSDVPAPTAKLPYLNPEPVDESVFTPAFLPAPAGTPPAGPKSIPAPVRPEPVARLYAPPTPAEPPTPSPAIDFPPPAGTGTLRGVDAPALPFNYVAREPDGEDEPAMPSAFAGMNLADVNPFADPPPTPEPEPEPVATGSRLPVVLWPLFAVNAVIEYLLGWFGPFGAVLTRPWMKTILGWVGVLLLLAAGGWAAVGRGWVSWPR